MSKQYQKKNEVEKLDVEKATKKPTKIQCRYTCQFLFIIIKTRTLDKAEVRV